MGNFWRLSAVLVAMAWASSVGAQVGPGPGGGSGSSGAVYGPTAAGTAAANPPVIIGGTVDGTATGAVDNLKVSGGLAFINCANCSGSGASAADEAAYVAGTSLFAPSGGFFQTTATTGPLTTGQQGLVQMTAYRAFMMNVRNSSGAELGLTAAPFIVAGAGVAGTPAGGVMSIQGVASGTVVPVSGTVAFSNSTIAVTNAGTFAVQATLQASAATAIGTVNPNTIGNWGLQVSTQNSATPTNMALMAGQFNTTPTTITSGNVSPFQLDNAGNLLVNIKAGAGSGGTALAEKIRRLLLDNDSEAVAESTELLLIFAARAQHIKHVIEPALAQGAWVLSDRFTDATFAYQGGGRNMRISTIEWLENLVQGTLKPDLTVLLDAPVEVGIERARQRGAFDRFESEKISFFEQVRRAYLLQLELHPQRIKLIKANQPLVDVQRALIDVISPLLR